METNKKVAKIENLTDDQKYKVKLGYKYFIISENGEDCLILEEPEEKTPEYIEYKKGIIDKNFLFELSFLTKGYTEQEVISWAKKEEEAKKVLKGEKSPFLEALCVEGETVEDLANLIMKKAETYAIEFAKIEKRKRELTKELTKNK